MNGGAATLGVAPGGCGLVAVDTDTQSFTSCCACVRARAQQGYRRALRRPLPAERAYLAAQFVGVGIQFGGLAPPDLGGRMVEGPLAGSPAEAAGIR
jgi:hypothetical protein